MIFSIIQKNRVFGYSWSTLLWNRFYYPHRSRYALSPVIEIFTFLLEIGDEKCLENIFPVINGQSAMFIWKARSKPGAALQTASSLIQSIRDPFPHTALWCHHAQTVGDSFSSYKINYVIVIKNFLNPKEHPNSINNLKVMAILMRGCILQQPCFFIFLLQDSVFTV